MRLCANENLPGECVADLRAAGHDVVWIRESMPGAADDAVLARALIGGEVTEDSTVTFKGKGDELVLG